MHFRKTEITLVELIEVKPQLITKKANLYQLNLESFHFYATNHQFNFIDLLFFPDYIKINNCQIPIHGIHNIYIKCGRAKERIVCLLF